MEVETVETNRHNILGWLKTDNISHGIRKQINGPAASSKTDRRFILLAPSALRYPSIDTHNLVSSGTILDANSFH